MSNEMYNVLARTTDGLYEGIAIGGDVFPGSTLSDHCLRYENIPQIKLIVVLGELGGTDEYSLVRGRDWLSVASGFVTRGRAGRGGRYRRVLAGARRLLLKPNKRVCDGR